MEDDNGSVDHLDNNNSDCSPVLPRLSNPKYRVSIVVALSKSSPRTPPNANLWVSVLLLAPPIANSSHFTNPSNKYFL